MWQIHNSLLAGILLVACATPTVDAQNVPRLGQGAMNVGWAIHDTQIDQIAIILKLSPEQEAGVRILRDGYELNWQAAMPDQRKRIVEVAEKYNAEKRVAENHNTTELAKELRSLADVLRVELARHDEVFFSQIEAILTDEQRTRMPRVRNWRTRRQLSMRIIERHEAAIDVMELHRIDSNRVRGEFYTPPMFIIISDAQYEWLSPAMDVYEPMLIAALDRTVRSMLEMSELEHQAFDLYTSLRDAGETPTTDPASYDDHRTMVLRYRRSKIGPMQNLERINQAGLQLFMDRLPADKAAQLEANYYATAWPTVYPDASSVKPLYDAALELADLEDERREAITGLRDVYDFDHNAMCIEMRELEREQFLWVWKDWQNERARSQLYVEISDAGMAREDLDTRHVELITQILQPEQLAAVLISLWEREGPPMPTPGVRRPRRDRDKKPPPVLTAMILRVIPTDVQREQLLDHIKQTLEKSELEPPQRAAAVRLLNFDYRAVETPRPWHQPNWIERAKQYDG